jgi:tRNA-splicing ligase RtcB
MPDCHCGHGVPVGTILPTTHVLVPAAVGVDIGCGMAALKTNLKATDLKDNLQSIYEKIEEKIPLGAGGAHQNFNEQVYSQLPDNFKDKKYAFQYKTLGSGNHFIEVSLAEDNQVWIVIHTGSRAFGHNIATKYMNIAQHYMENFYGSLKDDNLAFLPSSVPEFKEFVDLTLIAQDYARGNRSAILAEIVDIFTLEYPQFEILHSINCHHNFTQQEHHFEKNVWVTRKGAIQLQKGHLGIIPGSMGTNTFIVEGIGNKLSFDSAPHGAGRSMSRNKAKKTFSGDDLKNSMGDILYRHRDALIDEIPLAYKDINKVMEYSKPLLTIKHELKQILNIKGD